MPILEWWPAFLFLAELGVRAWVIVRVVQRGPQHSASSLAWILVVLTLPVFGVGLWFLVGEARLGSGRRERYAELADRIAWAAGRAGPIDEQREDPAGYEHTIRLAEAVGGTPPRRGNELTLMGDTAGVIDALVADLGRARATAHLCFYIYLPDETGRRVAAALRAAAARGVACRVLVDAVGSADLLVSPLRRELEDAGVRVVPALPVNIVRAAFARIDLRNHRKLAVIDGRIGYVGSQNVADASFAPKPRFAPWVDCMVRCEGPVVRDLELLFVTDWFVDAGEPLEELLARPPEARPGGVTAQVLPSGPPNDHEALAQLSLGAIHHAREELCLTTPYFVPGEAELQSLCTAARRGVRIVIVLPARNDSLLVGAVSRSHYAPLLAAGVEVHEFQHGLLHAKTMTVDRELGFVTTANFDRRSFALNFEVSLLVYDSDFASQLRFLQMDYVGRSLPVDPNAAQRCGPLRRFGQNAAGLFSPLL